MIFTQKLVDCLTNDAEHRVYNVYDTIRYRNIRLDDFRPDASAAKLRIRLNDLRDGVH